MRIRFSTDPPLPPIKAWHGIDNASDTILELKQSLTSTFSVGNQVLMLQKSNIILEMDGFELLDSSLCYSVLQEGDIISVKLEKPAVPAEVTPSSASTAKRKAERPVHGDIVPPKMKRAKPNHKKDGPLAFSYVNRTEQAADDVDVPSESDLSPSSSSASSSSSYSSTTSTSTSSSTPIIQPSRASRATRAPMSIAQRPFEGLFVPPGQGKASTRDRNRRRRLARRAKPEPDLPKPKLTDAISKSKSFGSPEALVSLTTRANAAAAPTMMLGLKNSNKRKGFMNRQKEIIGPRKLVFHDDLETGILQPAPTSTLIPPSERINTPLNMIITSVDVERGTRWQNLTAEYTAEVQNDAQVHIPLQAGVDVSYRARGESGETPTPEIDWEMLEKTWPNLKVVDIDVLKVGTLVAWQALAIDPITLSPRVMIHVGRVCDLSDEDIEVQLVHRPNKVEITFNLRAQEDLELGTPAVEVESFPKAGLVEWKIV